MFPNTDQLVETGFHFAVWSQRCLFQMSFMSDLYFMNTSQIDLHHTFIVAKNSMRIQATLNLVEF